MLLVNKIISSVLEIIVVGLIPFIWWFVSARKKEDFLQWIGLKKIEKKNRKSSLLCALAISVLYMFISIFLLYIIKDIETASSDFRGLGIRGLLPALVYAVFNTSLPEEIFFRGFLQKRLSNKLGYLAANIVQSSLFGLLHGVMFFGTVGVLKALMFIVYTGIIAFVMAYINEKKANGSILPSWIIHALSNIFASVVAMFSII